MELLNQVRVVVGRGVENFYLVFAATVNDTVVR